MNYLFILFISLFFAEVAQASDFTLTSPTIPPNTTLSQDQVLNGFGCAGKNLSPALQWKNIPAGTKSFAITVYDPDAPTGSGWWHWMLVDIPAHLTELPEGAGAVSGKQVPTGARQIRTDFGTTGFGGACPPQQDKPHRYIFTIYALKVEKLDFPADATAAYVGFMIHANKIHSASFTAFYGR